MGIEKPKCPLRNFENCLEEQCAFFITQYRTTGEHMKPIYQCAIWLIGRAASEQYLKLKNGKSKT